MAIKPVDVAARPRRLGVDAGHEHYKWWALSCTSLGMLLATINSGTLIIALPDLEQALGTSILELVWVILAYMISSTVLVLFAGRLSDLFGRKQAYVGGFVLFALTSLGAGFAGGGTELIVWRIVQGIGAAFLFANAGAIVTDAFPRDQLGLAMGTNTMVAAVGLVIGPVLGGVLVAISWHWVFWFNVPFALVGSLWAFSILRELVKPERVPGFDVAGVTTFVLGLTGLTYGLSRAGLTGWSDPLTIAGIVFGALLGGSVIVENVFNWPGIGTAVVGAILTKDYPIVQACVLVLGLMILAVSTLVDVALVLLNPRLKTLRGA